MRKKKFSQIFSQVSFLYIKLSREASVRCFYKFFSWITPLYLSLLNRVGCVVTWVRGLRGSNFYVGCVSYLGQNTFYVDQHFTWVIIFTWVTWVKRFCVGFMGQICFCVGLCVGPKFLRGPIFFYVGQLLFTR